MRKNRSQGFTIVEVLAAILILAMIVLMIGQLFDQSSKAWTSGEKQVYTSDLARGAMDTIYRDLLTAIADDALPFAVNKNFAMRPGGPPESVGFGGTLPVGTCDAMVFISASAPRSKGYENNDLLEVSYWVEFDDDEPGQLRRRAWNINDDENKAKEYVKVERKKDSHSKLFKQAHFYDPDADDDAEILAENVYSFEIIAYDDKMKPVDDFYSKDNDDENPPARIDIRMVLLTDEQWLRKNSFPTLSDWHDFVGETGEAFTLTAAFPTRGRYAK